MATLTEVLPCFFLRCKANARVKPAKTGHGPHSSQFFICSMYCLFCVFLYIVFVYTCTELLPPSGYPVAVKYIIFVNYHSEVFSFPQSLHLDVIPSAVPPTTSLTFKNRASYIWDGRTATLQMLHFIYFFSTTISTEYFNPLKPELNSICNLLALLAHHFSTLAG